MISIIIEKKKKRDREAEQLENKKDFLALFQQYQQDIYRMAYVYLQNREDALDVAQETAYQAYRKINTLKEKKYFKTWIIKITINCAIDCLRKKNRLPIQTELLEIHSSVCEDLPLTLSLQDLVDQLDEQEKTVVLLKYYQEFTFQDISDLMDIPLSTVKSTLYRSLDKLRKNVIKEDLYEQ